MITAQQEEGVVEETTSQEAVPAEQSVEQSQVPAVVKVDDDKPTTQVQTEQRPKPSEFYGFRKEIRTLKDAIAKRDQENAEMMAWIKSQKSPDPVETQSKFDKDVFFTDPEKVLSGREKAMLDKIEALSKEVSSFKENQSLSQRQKSEQDALEMLFPKTEGSPESLEERMESNQERVEKLMKLLKTTPVLDEAFKIDPKGTVSLIVDKLDTKATPNPTVLPKKLMGGAKGGSGATNQNPKDQKRAELRRLMDEASSNDELRFDEKHKSRRDQLIRELERLEKE